MDVVTEMTSDQRLAPCARDCERFEVEGYLRHGQLLDAEEVRLLRIAYDALLHEAVGDGAASNIAEEDAGRPQQMLQVTQACERSLAFRRLLYHPRILAVVAALIGPRIMLFHDQALYKPPRSGGALAWHQDNGYWQLTPARAVSCWLTLDDADLENGTMQVLPGSHRLATAHATLPATRQLKAETPDPGDVVVVDLPAGGCMFHHCQTLHYTAPNRTARPRRAFAIHYMPVGTRGRDGELLHPGWSRPVVSWS
jgi:phytanoyl-CoA hydroxylase